MNDFFPTAGQPYIPTDTERGAYDRIRFGLASLEEAKTTDHQFCGSHIRGWCLVCEQPQSAPQHGTIHFSNGGFACDFRGLRGVTAPMTRRTRRWDQTTCADCLLVGPGHPS